MKNLIIISLILLSLTGCRVRIYGSVLDKPEPIVMAEEKTPGQHPHFNDQNTLYWYDESKFDDALKTGKFIIVDAGRKSCKSCRIFIEKTLPKFKDRLKDNFVGVVSNIDEPAKRIADLIKENMSDARTLPFVMLLDKNGKWLGGVWGNITDKEFKELLDKAK